MNDFEKLSLRKFKVKSMVHNATVLLLGRRRSGKCLEKGTEIIMYDGSIKKIEDIKVGDLVMGDDSTPRRVLGTNNGIDTMYKITNKKGDSYTVNSEHILSLKYTGKKYIKDRVNRHSYQVVWFDKETIKLRYTTFSYKNKNKEQVYKEAKQYLNELIDDNYIDISIKKYMTLSKKYADNLRGYQVPIDFQHKNVQIDPYIMGKSLTSNSNSNVPYNYKCNSRENRLKLLAGFIDGHGNYKNNCFEIIKSSEYEHLLNDIVYVTRSLGFACYKNRIKTSFKVIISGDKINEIPSILNNSNVKNTVKDVLVNSIKIEKIGQGEYYGFELDGNHRFVLGNFIVTHNSYLVRDIFYHHKEIPIGLIFSGTEEANPFFGNFIPDSFIHSEYDPDLVETMLTKQSQKVKKARLNGHADTDGLTPSNRAFIVLDDMLHDAAAWKKEKTIQSIFFNGRHYNLFFILTMQYPLGIPPALRSNIDYVFIFNEPSIKNRKKIYDDYAGMIPSFDHFCNILDSCTQNHECLVIKTSGNSNDLREQIFWYKAEKKEDFRVGHPKIWKYHDLHYNAKYDQERDEEQEEIDKLKKKFAKTKKLKIIVNRQGNIQHATEESE